MDCDYPLDAELLQLLRVSCVVPAAQEHLPRQHRRGVDQRPVRLERLPHQKRVLPLKGFDAIFEIAQRCNAAFLGQELDHRVILLEASTAQHDDICRPPHLLHTMIDCLRCHDFEGRCATRLVPQEAGSDACTRAGPKLHSGVPFTLCSPPYRMCSCHAAPPYSNRNRHK